MAEIEDTHFETGDSGASNTYPQQCSALRKNGFVMLKVNFSQVYSFFLQCDIQTYDIFANYFYFIF